MRILSFLRLRVICIPALLSLLPACRHACGHENIRGPERADSVYTKEYIEAISISEPERAMVLVDSAEIKNYLSHFDAVNLKSIICQNGLHQNKLALYYCKELYGLARSGGRDPEEFVSLLERMSTLSVRNGYYSRSVHYATEGLEVARRYGLRQKEALLLLNMALAMFHLDARQEGQKYLSQSIAIFEEIVSDSSDWRLVDDYLVALSDQIVAYQDGGFPEKGIAMIPEINKALNLLRSCDPVMEGLVDMREAGCYALFAGLYLTAGENRLAEEYYRRLSRTDFSRRPGGAILQVPYLIGSKRFKEAMAHLRRAKKDMQAGSDTLSYDYVNNILARELEIYRGMGEYRAASGIALTMLEMLDSLRVRQVEADAVELSVAYHTAEKENELLRQAAKLRRRNMTLLVMGVTLLLGTLLLVILICKNTLIRRKNKATKALVNELLKYREEVLRIKGLPLEEPSEQEFPSVEGDEEEEEEQENASDEYDRKLFARIEQVIISKSLYLQPKLSREDIMKEVHVPKNRFSRLFKQYAGMGFPAYINNMRLDYAAQLLKAHPEYTVEAVAADCGIPVLQTFYRLFFEKFGLTPAEFRKTD